MPNCPTFIVYYFATLKAGGTVVNYNPLYTLEELTFQVRDSDTELMVTLDLKVLFDKVEALLRAGTLAEGRRCVVHRPAARHQVRAVQALQGQGAGPPGEDGGAAQCRARRGRAGGRQDAPAGADRPRERRCGAAIHRRHHRHPQGGDAHPRQHLRQLPAVRRLGDQPRERARSASWRRCRSSTCSP